MSDKMSLQGLVDSLLQESSRVFEDSPGLKWEWDHYLKIYNLVEAIRVEEKVKEVSRKLKNSSVEALTDETLNSSEEDRRTKNFPEFATWLANNGVSCDKIEFKFMGETGFGIILKKPVQAGEKVFEVPENIILTSTKVLNSKLKTVIERDPILRSMQNVALSIFLIHEKYTNAGSIWKPYIATLPSFYDTVLYFTKEEMEMLKHAPAAFREALKMLRNVVRQFSYFHIKFQKATDPVSRVLRKVLTLDRYIWGVSTVTTRLNHLPNPDGEEIASLIPVWDMCNHDQEIGQITTDFSDEERKLISFAAQDLPAGSEFKIFYGHRSSIDYLVHNGFVPEGYRGDIYYLELGAGINDPMHTRKKALLGHIGLMCQNTFMVKPERITTCRGLFAFVRIFLANKDTMEAYEADQDNLNYLNDPDEQSLKFLLARFTLLRRSAENSKQNLLKQAGSSAYHQSTSNRINMIAQVLQNEVIVLEQLVSRTQNLLNNLEQ